MQFCPRPREHLPLEAALTVHASRKMQSVGFRSEFSENKHRTGKSSTFSRPRRCKALKNQRVSRQPLWSHGYPLPGVTEQLCKADIKDNGKTTGIVRASCSTLPRSHLTCSRMNLPVCVRTLTAALCMLRLTATSLLSARPRYYKQALQSSPPHKDFQVYKSLSSFLYPIYSGHLHM